MTNSEAMKIILLGKLLMETHGQLMGLHKYWENKTIVPLSGTTKSSSSDPKAVTAPTPNPVHST